MPLDKLVPGVTGFFGPTLNTGDNFLCMPICSMQPLKYKNIVIKNEIHFDYVKLHGFNGNTYNKTHISAITYPRILNFK